MKDNLLTFSFLILLLSLLNFNVAKAEKFNQYSNEIYLAFQQNDTLGYKHVNIKPKFKKGGLDVFLLWVKDNIAYPRSSVKYKEQGSITLYFIVNTEGEVTDVKVLRGINSQLDREAVRVLNSSPRWTLGKQNGKPVCVEFVLPISFSLRNL